MSRPSFVVGSLCLPNCLTLSIQSTSLYVLYEPALALLLAKLPIAHLLLVRSPSDAYVGSQCEDSFEPPYQNALGLRSSPWPDLRSLEFVDLLFYEGVKMDLEEDSESESDFHFGDGLGLRTWPIPTIVVRLDQSRFSEAPSLYHNLFKGPDGSYALAERIEIHGWIGIEMSMREERGQRLRTDGLNAMELRLGPLVVFVDQDGRERRLSES